MRMFVIENLSAVCFRNAMVRITILTGALSALLLANSAQAASCDTTKAPPVPVVKGLAYPQARQAILSGGWQAVTGHPHNDLSSNETTFRDRGYTELQFCRISADSLCRFKFSAGNVVLWLTTGGEENPALDTQAIVKGAKLTCSDDPDPG
jgi:hypothetical protein